MTEISFPWPPSQLSPNARIHWAARAKIAKKYKESCYLLAVSAKLGSAIEHIQANPTSRIKLDVIFYPPDRRHRDSDNMVASAKYLLDGLAAALNVNDRLFLPTFKFEDEVKGMVKVQILAVDSNAE